MEEEIAFSKIDRGLEMLLSLDVASNDRYRIVIQTEYPLRQAGQDNLKTLGIRLRSSVIFFLPSDGEMYTGNLTRDEVYNLSKQDWILNISPYDSQPEDLNLHKESLSG